MKSLLLFLTIFLSTPSQAITWREFWRPFSNGTNGHFYYDNHHNRYTDYRCFKNVYREEYIPGNGWSRGYIRRWKERVRVPCYY